MKKFSTTLTLAVALVFMCFSLAGASKAIRFGVPPWPGVTVKTEVACQILETLGYETVQEEVGPPVVFKGMEGNDLDAFLGSWTPQQNPLLKPLKEAGKVEVVRTNLDDATISLCVPEYAYQAGVRSFSDLDEHGDKFERHIFNIEVGSPMHTAMGEIIENDVAGLGDWEQTGTTTPIMLREVMNKIDNNKWVAFACWKPHWMNVKLDMKYLKPVPGAEKFASDSLIHTVVRSGFGADFPEVYKFFKNLQVSSYTQSRWIDSFAQKGIGVQAVAEKWIRNNPEVVSAWLKGVQAKDGTAAIEKIRSRY